VKSSGAIAAVAPKRSAIPPNPHLLAAAAPVNASKPSAAEPSSQGRPATCQTEPAPGAP